MKVDLVAVTKGAGKMSGYDAEEIASFVARVSNPNNQLNMDTAPKLLNYCIKNKHWSPFEHSSMTVEIETSRAVCAQILRHRSFTFQEFSQRYQVVSEFELYPARRQDTKNRQNSIDDMSEEDKRWFEDVQKRTCDLAMSEYNEALRRGVAKEQARFLLPSSTRTTLYMTGYIRNWVHYIELRTDPSTQLEHREIAQSIKAIFIDQFPNISQALGWIT